MVMNYKAKYLKAGLYLYILSTPSCPFIPCCKLIQNSNSEMQDPKNHFKWWQLRTERENRDAELPEGF